MWASDGALSLVGIVIVGALAGQGLAALLFGLSWLARPIGGLPRFAIAALACGLLLLVFIGLGQPSFLAGRP